MGLNPPDSTFRLVTPFLQLLEFLGEDHWLLHVLFFLIQRKAKFVLVASARRRPHGVGMEA